MGTADRPLTALMLVNAVLLAILELFFLPLRFGVVMAPLSILVAAVTMPMLVRAAVRSSGSTATGGLVLFVWFVVLVVVGLFGPGGDMVFVPDWRSLALVAAGLITGAVALGAELGRSGRDRGAGNGQKVE